jgi:hypothetical protein
VIVVVRVIVDVDAFLIAARVVICLYVIGVGNEIMDRVYVID